MSDSSCPRMQVLPGASRFRIGTVNNSNVGRDQINHYYTSDGKAWGKRSNKSLPELSEFTEVKRGDIYKNNDVCYTWQLLSNGKDRTEAAVYIAQIMKDGYFGDSKFTVKTYHGQNAMKEWQQDFLWCSQDWHGNIPLFGYNKSSVPLLIFHGELIPLVHIEGRLTFVGWHYIELLKSSLQCAPNQLWVDPIKGRFCCGPIGPECGIHYDDYATITIPLDIEFLKEDVAIQYFSNKQDDWRFLGMLGNSCHFERPKEKSPTNHLQVISDLTGTTIASTLDVKWWSFKSCLGKRHVMQDQSTRFCLRDNQHKIEVESDNEALSWLSQALSVFDAHAISLDEDLSNYKLNFTRFSFTGTLQNTKCKQQQRQLYKEIYIFFLPSRSTLSYYWSLDPIGQTSLSLDMCKYLGLPFKLSIQLTHCQSSWPTKAYKTLGDYQIGRGFNPKSTDFAHSLGRHLFEVVTYNNCFQELKEATHSIQADIES